MAERQAVTKQMARRYERASKAEKGVMLDELCALTGWTRRHARRALALAARPSLGQGNGRGRGRPRVYGTDVLGPLRQVWAILNGPTGKRLGPFMEEIVTALERAGELQVDPQVRMKLCSVSPATIDRMLAPERKRLQVKGRVGTKPGTILKRQIPIRTFAQWDEARPGFCEVDLVAHDGGTPRGEFCQTLTLTCVNTGWTEIRALRNKAQRWCFRALVDIRASLPFPLLGLDSDNGGEFINNHLFAYCTEEAITFTRSRPERKNDNCFVEQKNWTVVRQQVGYARYDSAEELDVLAELYSHLRLYVNFFQPQTRLIQKTRRGATVSRRYDRARDPLPADPGLPPRFLSRQGKAHRDLPRPQPGPAQARPGGLPGPAAATGRSQNRPRIRPRKGGDPPTDPIPLWARTLEDIVYEATNGLFEDILK